MERDKICHWLGFTDVDNKHELLHSLSKLTSTHEPHKLVAAPDGAAPDPKPTPVAMGDKDVDSVVYVNFIPHLPNEAKVQLAKLEAELKLNQNWLSLRAGTETQKKMAAHQLPSGFDIDSQMKRAVYRAKVIDFLLHNSSWIGVYSTQGMKRRFNVRKSQFHFTLLSSILEGMTLPQSVYTSLEKVLKIISDGITSTSSFSQNKQMFWIMLTLFKWDAVQKTIRPAVRTIYFEVSQETRKYVSNKSSVQEVNFELGYMQVDADFNASIFEAGIDATIRTYLAEEGVTIVRKPIDIPVD